MFPDRSVMCVSKWTQDRFFSENLLKNDYLDSFEPKLGNGTTGTLLGQENVIGHA